MRFTSFLLALPLVASAATIFNNAPEVAVEKRQASTILSRLGTVNTDLNNLRNKLDSFPDNSPPSFSTSQQLVQLSQKLSNDIDSLNSAIRASPRLNEADCKRVTTYVRNTLLKSFSTLMQSFIDHEPGFARAGFTSRIRDQLVGTRSTVDSLLQNLAGKCSGLTQQAANKLRSQFRNRVTRAINAYS